MNAKSEGTSRAAASRRFARGLAAGALSAVLVAGLAACQTGRADDAAPAPVRERSTVPSGIDTRVPADRIESQLADRVAEARARGAAYSGLTADRIARELGETNVTAAPATVPAIKKLEPFPGLPADRWEHRGR